MNNQCEKCGREKEFTGTVLMSMPSVNVMRCRACEPFEFSGSAVAGRTYRSGPHIGGGMSDEPEMVEWDGTGLPPAGCEFEYLASQRRWISATMNYCGKEFAIIEIDGMESWLRLAGIEVRPVRSEADKKRDETKHAIAELCRSSASNGHSADLIYDAIAAGKIPGIRIE